MTLALLLTAVTGAWASGEIVVTVTAADLQADLSNPFTKDGVTIKCSDRMHEGLAFNELFEFSTTLGYFTKIEITNQYPEGISGLNGVNGFSVNGSVATWTGKASSVGMGHYSVGPVEQFVFTIEPAGPEVAWNASTKTGTFEMPGSDVVLTPIYAKAAAFATTGTEPDVKTLLPEAAEGVIAGTDAPLIKEGTGIVAFAGESTEVTQGTLMYAIGTSATQAPALTAFSATVPTAENVADDGADVYVWYYIQGADAPEGEAATLDNTFDDTEPACLTVQVLTNKFDIQFNAANANTIEAGKATVTVAGAAATVTDGKLQGVKMGSEVKLEAKPGYKFRKVEVKKKAAAEGHALTSAKFGEIVGSDGKAYAADDKDNLPSGVTAVAMICYVSGSNGLALALTDEGQMNWSTAQTTCAAHTPAITGGTWKLATKDEWDKMISAAGSTTDLRNGFSSVGVTNMQTDVYWASTEYDSSYAYYYDFYGDYWNVAPKGNGFCVRACLAF